MSFTYDLATNIGKVRLETQDSVTPGLLTDEEVAALITAEGGTSVLAWAARCCEVIGRKYAQGFNFVADGTTIDKGDRATAYMAMAKDLRRRAVGGVRVAQTINNDGYQRGRSINHELAEVTGFTEPGPPYT